jgi:undecaprenyl-diphosphatase
MAVIALSLAGTDLGSARLAKPLVERPRPSHEEVLQAELHVVTPPGRTAPYRGGAYGFFSSHAANHMGIAVLVGGLLGGGWPLVALVGWALVIGYSRIYLGVHYPGDVLVGAAWGAIWGSACLAIWNRMLGAKRARTA